MQRTTHAVPTSTNPPSQPAAPAPGPQLIDPSMFKFIGGGLPRVGGWSADTTAPSATSTSA